MFFLCLLLCSFCFFELFFFFFLLDLLHHTLSSPGLARTRSSLPVQGEQAEPALDLAANAARVVGGPRRPLQRLWQRLQEPSSSPPARLPPSLRRRRRTPGAQAGSRPRIPCATDDPRGRVASARCLS